MPQTTLKTDGDRVMRSSCIGVRAVVEAAELAGIDRTALLERAGLQGIESQDPYGWVDGVQYDRLLSAAVELHGSPVFGLVWARSSQMLQLELIPLLMANAPTLRHGLQVARAVQDLMHERPQLSYSIGVDGGRLHITPDASFSAPAARALADFMMLGCKRFLDYYAKGDAGALYAFAHDADEHAEHYVREFGGQARFGAARHEVWFPIDQLDAHRKEHNSELFATVSKQLDVLRARMAAKLSYSDRVKAELRSALPRLKEMGEVARSLGMSERSLRRRLADEGTSYTDLVERSQIDLASDLLSNPTTTIKSVAYELGFDTPSGFHRAFKRWTGQSPATYRRAKAGGTVER